VTLEDLFFSLTEGDGVSVAEGDGVSLAEGDGGHSGATVSG